MRVELVRTTPKAKLVATPWLLGALDDGRALVWGRQHRPVEKTSFAIVEVDKVTPTTGRSGALATDGTRLAFVTPTSLAVLTSPSDKKPSSFTFPRPTKNGAR